MRAIIPRSSSIEAGLARRPRLEALVHPQVLRRVARTSASIHWFMRARVGQRVVARPSVHAGRKRTRQPPPGSISATTGCTIMLSMRAMRDGASSVAAGTPKNGTKAASLMPKSMSGRLKKPRPCWRIARISGVARVAAARTAPSRRSAGGPGAPRRRRPGCSAPGRSSRHGRVWNNCTAAAATSSAMKCGTSHITGASLRSARCTSPSISIGALDALARCVPQQAALEDAAAEPAEVLAHQPGARARVQLRQAQLDVARWRCCAGRPPACAAACPARCRWPPAGAAAATAPARENRVPGVRRSWG